MAYQMTNFSQAVAKKVLERYLNTAYQSLKKLKQIAMTVVKVNNPLAKSIDGLMHELFNDFPANFGKTFRENVLHFPPVNITEKAEAYHIEVAAPGMEKSDFAIKLEDKLLTISAEQKAEATEENGKTIRREFSQKGFKRSFTLDDKIEAAAISARYENGILLVSLPKKAAAQPSTTAIPVL
jgi:HSP20 family protein